MQPTFHLFGKDKIALKEKFAMKEMGKKLMGDLFETVEKLHTF